MSPGSELSAASFVSSGISPPATIPHRGHGGSQFQLCNPLLGLTPDPLSYGAWKPSETSEERVQLLVDLVLDGPLHHPEHEREIDRDADVLLAHGDLALRA